VGDAEGIDEKVPHAEHLPRNDLLDRVGTGLGSNCKCPSRFSSRCS
jgi:hypothetical protein